MGELRAPGYKLAEPRQVLARWLFRPGGKFRDLIKFS